MSKYYEECLRDIKELLREGNVNGKHKFMYEFSDDDKNSIADDISGNSTAGRLNNEDARKMILSDIGTVYYIIKEFNDSGNLDTTMLIDAMLDNEGFTTIDCIVRYEVVLDILNNWYTKYIEEH